ncbi:hypothetical protein AB4345_05340 [Vibrio breoganii]
MKTEIDTQWRQYEAELIEWLLITDSPVHTEQPLIQQCEVARLEQFNQEDYDQPLREIYDDEPIIY